MRCVYAHLSTSDTNLYSFYGNRYVEVVLIELSNVAFNAFHFATNVV